MIAAILRERALWVTVAVACLVFGMLGTRGIWDPDEGRYTNVALTMLDSGDWIHPRRNEDTGHWTKPPLAYWAIAASVSALGEHAFAARLPAALSYLACILLVARLARRLAPGQERLAAMVYATMLLPVGASQLITTDFILAALQTLAVTAYVESRHAQRGQARLWIVAMWFAFGLGFLTKGPPALLALLAIAVYERLVRDAARPGIWSPWGVLVFLATALPWYVTVVTTTPGLLDYFLGTEVVERIAGSGSGRHPEWYGWLQVYVPTLVIGTMPWIADVARWCATLPSGFGRWRDAATRRDDAHRLFLALWILVPLAVFCLARSRLPLYLLPLFAPLALVVTMERQRRAAPTTSRRMLVAWLVGLFALKAIAASWSTHKNADEWATAIAGRAPWPVHEVVFVEDMARYGLHLHLGAEIEKVSIDVRDGRRFNPEFDEGLETELADSEDGVVFVCKSDAWEAINARIASHGYTTTVLGEPFHGRVIFRVENDGVAGNDIGR
ncbi:ArnT family glycosyltransferase [Dokdonella sp. MW10]|uniref:ArnT family glycosyltransferase n=1 Tax=Dokdonella sp. MW10 TaxID=2992926 RepID=UPI003F809A88